MKIFVGLYLGEKNASVFILTMGKRLCKTNCDDAMRDLLKN